MTEPFFAYSDEDLFILHKPPRFFVHPPESKFAKQPKTNVSCLSWLHEAHGIVGYPIHRLDFATEGLVLFARTTACAQSLNRMMVQNEIRKSYEAVVRGWFSEPYGSIELALPQPKTLGLVQAITNYASVRQIELDFPVNPQFSKSRYSWVDIEIKTGRWHQIRRHLNRVNHPVIGDVEHGDRHHNRFFKGLGFSGLALRAVKLQFTHPNRAQKINVTAGPSENWLRLQRIFDEAERVQNKPGSVLS